MMATDTALVRARGLGKEYGSGESLVRVVDNVDLYVARGETLAVMGPSGCGKSTLLHLLGGLDRPSAGELWLNGRRIDRLSERGLAQLRRHVTVAQAPYPNFGNGTLIATTPAASKFSSSTATAVGLALSLVCHSLGLTANTPSLVDAARLGALVVAGLVVLYLIVHVDTVGIPRALGWSLLAVVLLGPIAWPWYETWGIVFLAVAADRWSRHWTVALSVLACFATIPTGVTLSGGELVIVVVGLSALGAATVAILSRPNPVPALGLLASPNRGRQIGALKYLSHVLRPIRRALRVLLSSRTSNGR